jgi:carboxyl-terminal processing protease
MMKGKNMLSIALAFLLGCGTVYAYTMYLSDYGKLYQAVERIESEFIEPVDRTNLVEGAIQGMLESLDDPYTSYMDQEEAETFYQNINSSFEGIGATLEEVSGQIVVVSPLKNSPAEKAGLRPGDIITRIGDRSLEGIELHEAVPFIRGEKGTKAELTIRRSGVSEEIRLTIVRDTIPIQTVFSQMKENNIAVIRISSFAETTVQEFQDAVKDLKSQGLQGIVLDVRQNPGGITDAVEAISSTLVPEGKIIMQFESRSAPLQVVRSSFNDIGIDQLPISVLIDNGSASASEILAGALNQSANVPLVGEKTFGKGTAQISRPFSDGSSMKYTIARWLTPDGSSIDKKGLAPTIAVSLPDYASVPFINEDTTWRENQFSQEIKSAQTMLHALGFAPGRADGYYDISTKKAVIRFQQTHKLNETGILEGETSRKLMMELRDLIVANDTQLAAAIKAVQDQMK